MLEISAVPVTHLPGRSNRGPFWLLSGLMESKEDFGSAIDEIYLVARLDDDINLIPGATRYKPFFEKYQASLAEPPSFEFRRSKKTLGVTFTSRACLGEDLHGKADMDKLGAPDNECVQVFQTFCNEVVEVMQKMRDLFEPTLFVEDFDVEKFLSHLAKCANDAPASPEALRELQLKLERAGGFFRDGVETKAMSDKEFWKIIASVDLNALEAGDPQRALAGVVSALSQLTAEQIMGFEVAMTNKLYALDTCAHHEAAGGGDDGFLYARCYVVGRGRDFYKAALRDPSKMPVEDKFLWFESLLYVAADAWAQVTGDDPENFAVNTHKCYETGSNIDGW